MPIIFLILFTVGSFAGIYKLKEYKCKSITRAMEIDYKYTFGTGCFVKYNDQWIAYSKIRITK